VGISVSLSSQVERGVADPSLDSLRDIAEVLGAAPFRLLADDAPRSRVVCGGQGRRFSLAEHDVEMEFLSPSLDGAFEIGRWTPWPGGTAVHPRGHQVTEATLILARTVGLARREETIELREGDLVTYHAPIPHRCTALGTRPGSSS
jgi:transcriptional regulator with XRE-family HTH domain